MAEMDYFEDSQRALERSMWKRRQTDAIFEASQKIIAKSTQVIHDAKLLTSQLSKGAE